MGLSILYLRGHRLDFLNFNEFWKTTYTFRRIDTDKICISILYFDGL